MSRVKTRLLYSNNKGLIPLAVQILERSLDGTSRPEGGSMGLPSLGKVLPVTTNYSFVMTPAAGRVRRRIATTPRRNAAPAAA